MIYSLNGTLIYVDAYSAVIECGGVGYRFTASAKTLASLPEKGKNAFVYTYMNVREDAVDLFGFSDVKELDLFKLVISVNGVGPKIGIALMSEFKPEQLCMLIASSDAKGLTKAAGVGLKLAQRIVLELKDKVAGDVSGGDESTSAVGDISDSNAAKDAVAALVQFGYSQSEASSVVAKCDKTQSADVIIKQALRLLSTKF